MTHKHQKNIYFKPRLIPVPGTGMQWFYTLAYGYIIYYHKSSLIQMKRCNGYWAGEKSALRWCTAHRLLNGRTKKLTARSRIPEDTAELLARHSYWVIFKERQ